MVPESDLGEAIVQSGKPEQVLHSLSDFDPASWGLPPFPV